MVVQVTQERLVELKAIGELPLHIAHRLEELVEDGTGLLDVMITNKAILHACEECTRAARSVRRALRRREEEFVRREVSTSVKETMPERQPVFLHEHLEDQMSLGSASTFRAWVTHGFEVE